MTSPAKAYPRTPEPGNPARTEDWALLEAARQLHQSKDGPIEDFSRRFTQELAAMDDLPGEPQRGGLHCSVADPP